MAEPIVSFLAETIGKLLIEEAKFLSGVDDAAEQLHSDLEMMQKLLKDADERQHEAALNKEWFSQSRDVAYEAENILEDYAFKLALRRSKKGNLAMVRRYACIFNECRIRHKVGLEIQSLNNRISSLTRRFREYGIREAEREGSSFREQQLTMTYPYVSDDEDFVGFGLDVENLVEDLEKEDDFFGHYGVVSISGMGGSGKTTLARKVYNHPRVRSRFDSFAWVCISQQWQKRKRNILQEILVSLDSLEPEKRHDVEKLTDGEIVGQLLRVQQDKKCLVVLDDIWSTDAWECIKDAFPIRKKGNKILLTTRNKDVATHLGPHGYHRETRMLSADEGWELLQKKALKHGSSTGYADSHKLEELGREMVKICGGLPLAVVVLGGTLATKQGFKGWNLVYQNIKTYLGKGETIGQNQGQVQKILALSYHDLPYKLKPCFLYLGGFPEDQDIEVQKLYHLWIAEGMVFAEDRIGEETMMDVAERYLEELIKRCIVHVRTELPEIRKYISCHLHDLMRDLCLEKAREDNFLEVIDYGHENGTALSNSTSSSSCNIHRIMNYLSERDASEYVPPEMEATKHLRTLMFCARGVDNLIAQLAESRLNRFKMLKSLTIEGVITPGLESITDRSGIPDDVFKLPIGNLIHLRYLSLRRSVLVISPLSISSLKQLETLDLSYAKLLWTTNVPLNLRQLRYLYVLSTGDALSTEEVRLLHDFKMQIYVSDKLEIFEGFDPSKIDVKNRSELSNLRELQARLFDQEKDIEEIIKDISNSHQLKRANIETCFPEICSLEMEAALLEQLFTSKLQYLSLFGRLRKLPKYNSQIFKNLFELRLLSSNLEEDPMEMLEKLPSLQRLVLWNHVFTGNEMVCHAVGFPELRSLVLHHLHDLEKWTVEEGAMANLSHLEMSCCESLQMVPEGLWFIATLKELALDNMSEEFMSDYELKLRMRECC